MENRAGEVIQAHAIDSARTAAVEAYEKEMEEVGLNESMEVKEHMEGPLVDELGVCPMLDISSPVRLVIDDNLSDSEWTDVDSDQNVENDNHEIIPPQTTNDKMSPRTPVTSCVPSIEKQQKKQHSGHSHMNSNIRRRLDKKYPCKTRSGMSCAIDTAWQKRGFDSLTSHTFLMSKSKYGKKVVKTMVSHWTCAVCNYWRRNRPGEKVCNHQCVRNHVGSARMMESVSGEKGILEMKEEGTPVDCLEGDGDNTLIARLKSKNIVMEKKYDKNHIIKNIGKRLYSLQNVKVVKISRTVIHLEKCLKYAFARNDGKVEELRANLKAIIPHQFGDHSLCNEEFCAVKRHPGGNYIHKSLPYKRCFTDTVLREKLQEIFDPLAANASQYAHLGSSQQCEHANKEVALRAPKSHHYGHTKSLDYRVQATAAFVNEGRHYIPLANKRMGLSPGVFTEHYAGVCHKRRISKQLSQRLPLTKRRRLVLKQERATNQGALEALEGVSYQSGAGHETEVDIEQLPDPVSRGVFKPVKCSCPMFVTFDLETTDLICGTLMPHITQIAAKELESGQTFSMYTIPKMPIATEASRITGICVVDNNEMMVHGKMVTSNSVHNGLIAFFDWLKKFDSVFLVAHNGRRFDFPVLLSALINTNLTSAIFELVLGFIDSLPVFKKKFPGGSMKQEDLVTKYLGISYNAHNAVSDVDVLGRLIKLCDITDLTDHSFPPLAVKHSVLYNIEKCKNIRTLDPLVRSGICKRPTAENIAGSGLTLNHLSTIYKRSGEDGLHNTFTALNSDGQPRVTSVKKVLEEVVPKLGQYFSNQSSL